MFTNSRIDLNTLLPVYKLWSVSSSTASPATLKCQGLSDLTASILRYG